MAQLQLRSNKIASYFFWVIVLLEHLTVSIYLSLFTSKMDYKVFVTCLAFIVGGKLSFYGGSIILIGLGKFMAAKP